jgi:hypothetical protein
VTFAAGTRKGFIGADDMRGLLRVPSDVDPTGYERNGYGSALRAATARYSADL